MGAYMGVIVVIGEPALVSGYAMAGATTMPARGADEVRRAWESLPSGTTLVILTAGRPLTRWAAGSAGTR